MSYPHLVTLQFLVPIWQEVIYCNHCWWRLIYWQAAISKTHLEDATMASSSVPVSQTKAFNVSHAPDHAGAAFITVLGRLLFVAIFVLSGPRHFAAQTIGYA